MRGRNFNGLGGLSGHASSMITSLKNNLRRKNIDKFKSSKAKIEYKEGTIDKKATPEQLKAIREKLQKENKKKRIITILYFVISFIILMILLKVIVF
ncbi:hypothetical protein UMM65_11950 [Aureibaculum sp. 2210JD6-5]|uniref:hypothetical protein n=1 Tax=Aureibaculum sp. 2210JD6-5 TaxID=3103957 RepID=UPI002AADBC97|nr:hypothetical protein [Aureibaculum sp. 2210JD6-5]MDY7395961.1 hypothetical protein [Aureibaculum sp. 2210JD6-5]